MMHHRKGKISSLLPSGHSLHGGNNHLLEVVLIVVLNQKAAVYPIRIIS